MMLSLFRPALAMLVLFTLLTGAVYPLVITGIAQLAFPYEAHGSLIARNGKVVGSRLIGQSFASDRYFWPRPSAAGQSGYDAAASSGSNLGPTSKALMDRISAEAARRGGGPLAGDAATASGSGLDPDVSRNNALQQVARVAAARGIEQAKVSGLVEALAKGRALGIFGEPRVNVLELNLALDGLPSQP